MNIQMKSQQLILFDGSLMASGSKDNNIKIWDLNECKLLYIK